MEDEKKTFTGMKENHIEGRNAVLEAFRSGRTIDKLYVLAGRTFRSVNHNGSFVPFPGIS